MQGDSRVIMRFYVHEADDRANIGSIREERLQYNDMILIQDQDVESGTLASGQEGVTQKVCSQ